MLSIRRPADETDDLYRKQGYLDMEARWLHLARSTVFFVWLKAASNVGKEKNMSDWLHTLPVLWMALLVFGFTYLVTAVIYAVVAILAGRSAPGYSCSQPQQRGSEDCATSNCRCA